jgi:cell division protein FtsL
MIRALSILFWFALTIVVSLALYGTSYRVQEMSKQLRTLNAQIEAEQVNIHVLKAEWVYLANPARIEIAARKYLAMHPTALKQIAKLENLPEILPTRKEAMAGVTVEGTPIASIDSSLPVRPTATHAPVHKVAKDNDSGHVNTRIVIQPAPKTIPLSQNNPDSLTDEGHILLANYGSPP